MENKERFEKKIYLFRTWHLKQAELSLMNEFGQKYPNEEASNALLFS